MSPVDPQLWRFSARPNSTEGLVGSGERLAIWTTDRAGNAARGDLVLLYASHEIGEYVAIGRLATDARMNRRARRRIKDREGWAYLQIRPFRRGIPEREISTLRAAVGGSGILTPTGHRANRVSAAAAPQVLDHLAAADLGIKGVLADWRRRRGDYPADRELDLEELEWSDLGVDERQRQEELLLSQRIAKHLTRRGSRYRYLEPGELGDRKPRRDRGPEQYSLEHHVGGRERVDVLLVDADALAAGQRRLLAIEVKVRASIAVGRNPVPQIEYYRGRLEELYPGWSVETRVVARRFQDAVLEDARAAGVPHHVAQANGRLSPTLR